MGMVSMEKHTFGSPPTTNLDCIGPSTLGTRSEVWSDGNGNVMVMAPDNVGNRFGCTIGRLQKKLFLFQLEQAWQEILCHNLAS